MHFGSPRYCKTDTDNPRRDICSVIKPPALNRMIEPVSIQSLKEAIERMQSGVATFAQTVPVWEGVEGLPAWEGVVHVFRLKGNDEAATAFAWSSPAEGISRHIHAVLAIAPIHSPGDAVRASIVERGR